MLHISEEDPLPHLIISLKADIGLYIPHLDANNVTVNLLPEQVPSQNDIDKSFIKNAFLSSSKTEREI